mmetsp:Transcript_4442/g.9390  ORF Transcript_4442/g.9390 Transcript_4442/m.9390 type:complete len:144 (-) Transcript_4442:175-606(-)
MINSILPMLMFASIPQCLSNTLVSQLLVLGQIQLSAQNLYQCSPIEKPISIIHHTIHVTGNNCGIDIISAYDFCQRLAMASIEVPSASVLFTGFVHPKDIWCGEMYVFGSNSGNISIPHRNFYHRWGLIQGIRFLQHTGGRCL